MYSTHYRSWLLLAALLLCCGAAGVRAQVTTADIRNIRPKLNSPLSRFGLGNPIEQTHAVNMGMGGMFATYQDGYHLNIQNPASLASLVSTSFEIGAYGRRANLSDATGTTGTNQGNLRYLALGFPLRNPINLSLDRLTNTWNAGMAFSVAPTTVVGYDLVLEGDGKDLGPTLNTLRGEGGAYRFTWSNGFRYRTFSLGLNVNYNFGKITNSRIVTFEEFDGALASELREESSLGGVSLGYGLQYAFNFKSLNEEGEKVANGKRILVGVSGALGEDVESNNSRLLRSFTPDGELPTPDTVDFFTGQLGTVTLPASFNAGIAYEDFNRLYIGVEFGRQSAGDYFNSARPIDLLDANHLAFGIQYIPNISSFNSYWKRVRYRFGVRIEDDPRQLEGVQARRNAVTLGAGFPLRLPRNQVSFIDLALEAGQFGVPDVLDENYVQLTLGFSLNDNSWFFKRKLN